ncbi:outer membrane beta-barrel protein [Portibacter marinus]|uniref:outer membrane beta-barrel protein n=1 Tax=Portibacter marinus TaxID=2898660 RepID=UPI001F38CD6F|nr:outer membrane beta-barrel protein [Portibacter marinus]
MIRNILVLAIILLSTTFLAAQFDFGLRAGVSTQAVNSDELELNNGTSSIRVNLANASYGYHFGLYGQFKAGLITITPEILFNSNSYSYRIQEFSEAGAVDKIIDDKYQFVDIPVLVGLKLGPLRAYAGPEVHYFVNSYGKLAHENGFEEQVNKINYGGIAGAGLNIGKLRLDLRYELNFSDFEDHIMFDDGKVDFNTDDSRLIFSLGYRLN